MREILQTLLEVTVYSGIIFAAIMLLKRIFKNKMSPMLHLWIWVLLLARLVLPMTFDSALRLFVLPGAQAQEQVAQRNAPVEAEGRSATPVQNVAQKGENALQSAPAQRSTAPDLATDKVERAIRWGWENTLLLIWVTGICVTAILAMVAYRRLRKRVMRNRVRPTSALLQLLENCKAELGISRRVCLMVQCDLASPALLFPNIVLIPADLLRMQRKQVRMAMLHELTHFRRRDHVLNIFLLVLRCVYWFNPFVWGALQQMWADMETACDHDVVKRWQIEERNHYARTVLMMFGRSECSQMVLGMALGNTRKTAEQRIRGIYLRGKSKGSSKVAALVVACVIGFSCFTTACQPTPEKVVIVNKAESFDEITDTSKNTPVQTVPYTVPERWEDHIEEGTLTIDIDTDVVLPVDTGFPVAIMQRQTYTQQQVNDMVEYFAQGRRLYRLPRTQTKEEIAQQIVEIKQTQQNSESAEWADSWIAELEAQYETAPEQDATQYVDATLTERVDAFGAVLDDQKQYLRVGIEQGADAESIYQKIGDESITLQSANSTATSSWFIYADGTSCNNESFYRGNLDAPDIDVNTDPAFQDWENQIRNTSMTQEQAMAESEKMIQDLGIEGMVLHSIEGLAMLGKDGTPVKGGYSLIYKRGMNGLMGYVTQNWVDVVDSKQPEYAPPFMLEEIKIDINEDGVHLFAWDSAAKVSEMVNENAELIPFEEIQQAAIRQIKYKFSYEGSITDKIRVEVGSAKLHLGHIGVKDDVSKAMMIPLWIFDLTEYYTLEGSTEEYKGNNQGLGISALDGSVVNVWVNASF